MVVVKRISVAIILMAAFAVTLGAQTITEDFSVTWPEPATSTAEALFCNGCQAFDGNSAIPVYTKRLAMGKRLHGPVKILKIVTEEVQDFPAELSDFVPSDFEINFSGTNSREKVHNLLSVVPYRLNPEKGKIEKLVSFELEYALATEENSGNQKTSQTVKNKKSNSLLASGTWVKVGVTADGVYKLTRENLVQMGIDAGSIDPRNIQMYGYGGGMLPKTNKPENLEEMQEIPVFVQGEQDGTFDNGDYLLFYAGGPHTWSFNNNSNRYAHQLNYYTDTIYYLITVGASPGKRIDAAAPVTSTPDYTTSAYDALAYHEPEEFTKINDFVKSGKDWYGEEFDVLTSREYTFNIPAIDLNEPVFIKTVFGARSGIASSFNISHNGQVILDAPISAAVLLKYTSDYIKVGSGEATFTPSAEAIKLRLTYQKSSNESRGWLNYIRLNARAKLDYRGNQLIFSDKNSINKVTRYNLSNASDIWVWEVTDQHNIKSIALNGTGAQKDFVASAGTLKKFAAFTPAGAPTPILRGRIQNQDLRGITSPDMLIIAHPLLMGEAKRLAEHRKNYSGFSVEIVTPAEIYNEFSAGTQDISAIRNFVKFLYDGAATPESRLKYLLLIGDASYDYKNRIKDNTNMVPTYQGIPIYAPENSIATDDFFGILKDGEGDLDHGNWARNFTVDIGIGRIPAHTVAQATGVVNKIIRYETEPDMGDWKNIITFLSDDEDGNAHVRGNEYLSAIVKKDYNVYNQEKIIFDAYPQETTPGGQSYPLVKKAVNDRMNAGCLVFNYMGHGGENGLAHERVVEIPDINSWSNNKKLPLFITATCEFSRFDDPKRMSAGEYVILNPNGGAVAMLTTTRIAWIYNNEVMTQNLFKVLFKPINGEMPTLGQVYMQAKNNTGLENNSIIFALLGDPSMKLAYPQHNVVTTAINGVDISVYEDTLKALSFVTIKGEVQDAAGQKVTGFNGNIYPTVFDKPGSVTTLGQDATSHVQTYQTQDNIIYKGKATVENGSFSFSFVVPKDINYRDGFGKISYYAANGATDGHGYDEVMIGGTSDSAIQDNTPPVVRLFMNDTTFKYGGLTNESPWLHAIVEDDNGINTTGNGIGHNITAVLDDGPTIVLNNFYESEENNHRKGVVRYPFSNLSDGHHTLRFKVWDVANNSAEATTEFVVASSAKLALEHLMAYPNPFKEFTNFSVEHNKQNEAFSVEISIFDLSGNVVTSFKKEYSSGTARINDIQWDGKNGNGHNIAAGLYVYRLVLRTAGGEVAAASDKLVLVK